MTPFVRLSRRTDRPRQAAFLDLAGDPVAGSDGRRECFASVRPRATGSMPLDQELYRDAYERWQATRSRRMSCGNRGETVSLLAGSLGSL